jgi:polyisoprenoid-binding protein YceI
MIARYDRHHTRRSTYSRAGGVNFPAPGLWNIPSGWARIELSMPRILGSAVQTCVRLKQGMIAVADDPVRSTAHLSLDAASLRTGHPTRDRFLHDEVLDTSSFATIPVRIATVEHVGGMKWKGLGWITIRGVSAPIELEITYEGTNPASSAARFRAQAKVSLRKFFPEIHGIRGRFVAGRQLRIAVDIHAEPVRASIDSASRQRRRDALSTSSAN